MFMIKVVRNDASAKNLRYGIRDKCGGTTRCRKPEQARCIENVPAWPRFGHWIEMQGWGKDKVYIEISTRVNKHIVTIDSNRNVSINQKENMRNRRSQPEPVKAKFCFVAWIVIPGFTGNTNIWLSEGFHVKGDEWMYRKKTNIMLSGNHAVGRSGSVAITVNWKILFDRDETERGDNVVDEFHCWVECYWRGVVLIEWCS
jgi:hypothetical protein